MEIKYTEIYPHPLNKSKWCLIVKGTSIPPFIGSKKECIEAQKIAEKKAIELSGNK